MFTIRVFFISILTLFVVAVKADSTQSIDVLNSSARAMNIDARNADSSFVIHQSVPAFTKWYVISKITELDVLQDRLFTGIFRNSAEEVRQAIASGADVNKLREGKSPLAWALSFNMVNAAACLLQHGAR